MPKLKFQKVISCSSEHSTHQASNLLLEPGKGIKWVTNKPGDDTAEVILQLEEPCKIKNINIGNAHSANVSILVKNSMRTGDDFETILPVVTLMSPIESRNSEKVDQVKTFLPTDLDQKVSNKDCWDLIKVVCTQPFNKQVSYGLAFISVFGKKSSKDDDSKSTKVSTANVSKPVTEPSPRMFGKFKFREDSPEDEELKGLNLLNRWKNERKESTLITPPSKPKPKPKVTAPAIEKVVNRNRASLLYDDDSDPEDTNKRVQHSAKKLKESEKNSNKRKIDAEKKTDTPPKRTKTFSEFLTDMSDDRTERSQQKEVPASKPNPVKVEKKQEKLKINAPSTSHAASTSKIDKPLEKPKIQDIKPKIPVKKRITKPFNKLFEGVTFVISGIQNPERADIRKQALEMGARYNGDWNDRCTHLICAFKNTPKYREVQRKGKIVTKDWILKSYSKRMRLPWRRYALDDRQLDQDESEDEIFEEKPEDAVETLESHSSSKRKKESHDEVLAMYDLNYDAPSDRKDDEVYDRSTEDEDNSRDKFPNKSHKLFASKSFYLHINLKDDDVKALEATISKHAGTITKDTHEADYVISNKRLNGNALGIKGDILDPKWVFECTEMESFVPVTNFLMNEE